MDKVQVLDRISQIANFQSPRPVETLYPDERSYAENVASFGKALARDVEYVAGLELKFKEESHEANALEFFKELNAKIQAFKSTIGSDFFTKFVENLRTLKDAVELY